MLSHWRLLEILRYDPATGLFYRRSTRGSKKSGERAGSYDKDGYVVVVVDRKNYKAHRLAWFYMTKAWPVNQIDHVNLVRSDNSWGNLREASISQQQANSRPRSILRGVRLDKRTGRFRAIITKDRRPIHLGMFKYEEDARRAYAQAAKVLFGEFARVS